MGLKAACRHRLLGVAAIGVSGVALCAPAAHAASLLTPVPASTCAVGATAQAFSQWGDENEYQLAPGGNFSSAVTGWTLTGGAEIVAINVPFSLGGEGTVGALELPPGATAQSPSMCVDPADPTYRFIDVSGGDAAQLSAQAVYSTVAGAQIPLTSNTVSLSSTWGPSPTLQTGAEPASLLGDGTAQMSLDFESTGGTAIIDDVFVDPRMHGS